ncbi:MAG TPA: hypothetical protein VME40_05100 [Caulobacteraceae bacterium]|nr:hypothetical protein [Caulobacteraceae bacterium]
MALADLGVTPASHAVASPVKQAALRIGATHCIDELMTGRQVSQ